MEEGKSGSEVRMLSKVVTLPGRVDGTRSSDLIQSPVGGQRRVFRMGTP